MKYEIAEVTKFHRAFGHPVAKEMFTGGDEDNFGIVTENPPTDKQDYLRLRTYLIEEEFQKELQQAVLTNDRVEIADGIGDTLVVNAGLLVSIDSNPPSDSDYAAVINGIAEGVKDMIANGEYHKAAALLEIAAKGIGMIYGIPVRAVFDEVHRSNMSKLDADGKPVPHPTIPGKIGKSELYQPPLISHVIGEFALVDSYTDHADAHVYSRHA